MLMKIIFIAVSVMMLFLFCACIASSRCSKIEEEMYMKGKANGVKQDL